MKKDIFIAIIYFFVGIALILCCFVKSSITYIEMFICGLLTAGCLISAAYIFRRVIILNKKQAFESVIPANEEN